MHSTIHRSIFYVCIIAVFAITQAAAHAEIVGQASVIDGDTIDIRGKRIRLHGIDAPESAQLCEINGKKYRCGQKAANALDGFIDEKTLHCHEKGKDRYKRIIAECFAGAVSVNAWLVENGHALDYRKYSDDYIDEEHIAQSHHAGIWAGLFQPPWEYRHGKHAQSLGNNTPPLGCEIKGNINAHGEKLYHMPNSRWYNQVKINTQKGELWFCSEKVAIETGWKKAR